MRKKGGGGGKKRVKRYKTQIRVDNEEKQNETCINKRSTIIITQDLKKNFSHNAAQAWQESQLINCIEGKLEKKER
jgi:hypothetical protein